MKKYLASTVVLVSGILLGCQSVPYQGQAHDVKVKPREGGIVSIPVDPRPEDRSKADERMKSTCAPFPSRILEEGETVVGAETQLSGQETNRASTKTKIGSIFGMPLTSGQEAGKNTSSSTVTKNLKEWYITYSCETKASARLVH